MAARKHPYAMLAAMISIASIVVVAVTTVAVSIFGGMFLMYGTMRDIQANQAVIIDQQVKVEGQVSVVKTYSASILGRQDFMIGLMTKEQQERVNAYDRANPRVLLPDEVRKQ